MKLKLLIIISLMLPSFSVFADQPIMNMMPRWDGGYGYQLRTEYIQRNDLLQGDEVVAKGFSESIYKLHFEGVYTWDRSIRLTVKLPYVIEARREQLAAGNVKQVERSSKLGDMTLALPLKQYFNLDGRSGSWTFAPQLRVPTSSKSASYDIYDREWGVGAALGYEIETSDWFFSFGISRFVFEKDDPNEFHSSIDLGLNFRDNAQFLWETDFYSENDGSQAISAGPALYWRFSDVVHTRVEWKHDFKSRVGRNELDHGNGDVFSVGVGFVW